MGVATDTNRTNLLDAATSDIADTPLRRRIEERLRTIEVQLYWRRRFDRGVHCDLFHLGPTQAAQDMRRYRDNISNDITYDAVTKSWRPNETFKPVLIDGSIEEFLGLLRSSGSALLFPNLQDFAELTLPQRLPKPECLLWVIRAIEDEQDIRVTYFSVTSGRSQRWIRPHAMAFDGDRFHVRAYDHRNQEFRDFVLGRIRKVHAFRGSVVDPDLDDAWMETTHVILTPNPGLSDEQRQAVAYDYNMTGGDLTVVTRRALTFYLQQRLKLTDDYSILPAQSRQLVAKRKEECDMLAPKEVPQHTEIQTHIAAISQENDRLRKALSAAEFQAKQRDIALRNIEEKHGIDLSAVWRTIESNTTSTAKTIRKARNERPAKQKP